MEEAELHDTLKRSAAALADAGVPYLVAGSIATWVRGGPDVRHDLDFVVRPEDADSALDALTAIGMRPERPPEGWLLKAWDGEVLVDLIFHPAGLDVDDALFARAEELPVAAMTMPVMAVEDVLATKLHALAEHRLDYTQLIRMARALRERIDWGALRERAEGAPYAPAFFALCDELGIAEPGSPSSHGARVTVVNE